MKKALLLMLLLFLFLHSFEQSDYRVVFDLTSKDSIDQRAVVRWLNEIIGTNPDAKLEVVMYAQGVHLVTNNRSPYQNAVMKLLGNKNISFKVCAIALKNQNIDRSQLLPGVEVVPDGIYEIVSRQRDGWGYIKAKQ